MQYLEESVGAWYNLDILVCVCDGLLYVSAFNLATLHARPAFLCACNCACACCPERGVLHLVFILLIIIFYYYYYEF